MQEEEAQYNQVGEECPHGLYHMLRTWVIIEGHPCSMLAYPRMAPFIFLCILKSWSPGDYRAKGKQGIKPRLASAYGCVRGVLLQLGNLELKLGHRLLEGREPFFGLRRDAASMCLR